MAPSSGADASAGFAPFAGSPTDTIDAEPDTPGVPVATGPTPDDDAADLARFNAWLRSLAG